MEENGKNYWFMDREDMEREIHENKFLENGDYNGNLYGTHLDSIRNVIKQGKCHWVHFTEHFFLQILQCPCDFVFRQNVRFGLCTECIENAS